MSNYAFEDVKYMPPLSGEAFRDFLSFTEQETNELIREIHLETREYHRDFGLKVETKPSEFIPVVHVLRGIRNVPEKWFDYFANLINVNLTDYVLELYVEKELLPLDEAASILNGYDPILACSLDAGMLGPPISSRVIASRDMLRIACLTQEIKSIENELISIQSLAEWSIKKKFDTTGLVKDLFLTLTSCWDFDGFDIREFPKSIQKIHSLLIQDNGVSSEDKKRLQKEKNIVFKLLSISIKIKKPSLNRNQIIEHCLSEIPSFISISPGFNFEAVKSAVTRFDKKTSTTPKENTFLKMSRDDLTVAWPIFLDSLINDHPSLDFSFFKEHKF